MWILTGPFDTETNTDIANYQKSKLLKTGKSYNLGRKDRPLVIKHQRISKDHGEFQVGSSTNDDISTPSLKPTLQYVHKRDRKIKIDRGGTRLDVEAYSTETLQDGDIIWPIGGVKISVKWETLCCYCPPGEGQLHALLQGCTPLGIILVHTPNQQVTHHLINSFKPSAAIAASLLSACQFVKGEWLEEVLRLGNEMDGNPSGVTSLEWTFALPPLSRYRPSFSPALQDSQKAFHVWEPNEERLNMLNNYRFLLLAENKHEIGSDVQELIQRGGGTYELFDARTGKSKLHQSLVRGNAKEGQKLVVVGDTVSLKTALDEPDWQDLLDEIELFSLPFVSSDAIIQAVININTSAFDVSLEARHKGQASQTASSNNEPYEPLPSVEGHQEDGRPGTLVRSLSRTAAIESRVDTRVDNVITAPPGIDEPMGPQSPGAGHSEDDRPRTLVCSSSRAISLEPEAENPLTGRSARPALPRSTRRQLNTVIGSVPPTQPVFTAIDLTVPVLTRPKPPKRRREASEPRQETETLRQLPEPGPRTKKIRKDFDLSQTQDLDVVGMYSQLPIPINIGPFNQGTQTQTQTQSKAVNDVQWSTPKLAAVLEEEEETQVVEGCAPDSLRGVKRKAEMAAETETAKASKKPKLPVIPEPVEPTTHMGASRRPPPSKMSDPRQPDTDTAFLKAVASTKQGKKKEDDMDRDFNNLKIARPEIDHREEQWDVVDDFENDIGIRGNFMVIMEMEIKEHWAKPDQVQVVPNWQGKANFKKFKKRAGAPLRGRVELVISEDNDYGLGPGYWKGGNSQSQGDRPAPSQSMVQTGAFGQALVVHDSDNEMGNDEKVTEKGKGQRKRQNNKKTGKTKAALFLHSDEDGESTLKSSPGSQGRRRGGKVVVDDDSDDGAVFKGFKGRKGRK